MKLKLNLENEQILIKNTREIHENSKNANLIGFLNRLAVSFHLTDIQPLDIYLSPLKGPGTRDT